MTVQSGGGIVLAGGTVSGLKINSGGRETLRAHVSVGGLVVSNGTTLIMSSGGTASGTRLAGGTEVVSSGGKVAGTTTFTTNSELSVATGSGTRLTVSGFTSTDRIELSAFKFSGAEKFAFVESAAKTSGTLRITDGAVKAAVILFGQYTAIGFHLAADGAGTDITDSTSSSGVTPELSINHS